MITSDSPYREIDRTTVTFGMPVISVSTGMVINRSTSSEAWPGHWVMISTMGGERSGYASTGSRRKEKTPPMITATAISSASSGCESTDVTILWIADGLSNSDGVVI